MTLTVEHNGETLHVYERTIGPESLRRIGVSERYVYQWVDDRWRGIGLVHSPLFDRAAQERHYTGLGYVRAPDPAVEAAR